LKTPGAFKNSKKKFFGSFWEKKKARNAPAFFALQKSTRCFQGPSKKPQKPYAQPTQLYRLSAGYFKILREHMVGILRFLEKSTR
jgi:hypothetical protein